jgi:hypothetical protein
MRIAERQEGEIVPQGLSVTRTSYSDMWRLRIGDHMVRLHVPKRPGLKKSCELVKMT